MCLIAGAVLVAEHEVQVRWLSGYGTWALSPPGLWKLPEPGVEPMSPALAGGFLSIAPLGTSSDFFFFNLYSLLGLVHPSSWITHFHFFSFKLIFIAL